MINEVGLLFSELSPSESMSVGSGTSKVGSCGEVPEVNFSPVEVNAPESLMNTARAAMPLARGFQKLWEGEFPVLTSELRPLGFVSVACSNDVLACLRGFSAFAVDALLGEDLFSEFSCVCTRGRCCALNSTAF